MKRAVFSAVALAAAVSASPAAAQGCSRELLEGIANDWVAAIEQGSALTMKLGEWVEYEENMKLAGMTAFFDKPRKVDWHLALLDPSICRILVESVVLDEERPMVLASRVANGFFGVGPIFNIVTDEGDWLFDAKATYEYARREDWSPIPEDQRMTRAELIAVANAYLDRLNDNSAEVPWGTPCARLEGGTYIAGNSCDAGLSEGTEAANREYLVDETIGAVNVFLKLGEEKRPNSHTFRVENGKIRYVHAVTNCGDEPNCGLPPLAEMLKDNPGLQPAFD